MPNLYNPSSTPVGIRRCYWDAEYIASQPFCITSKLTASEVKQLLEFEEMKFWERSEQMKETLSLQAYFEIEEALEEFKNDGIMAAAERGLKSLDSITSKLAEELYQKHAKNINKSDYLTR